MNERYMIKFIESHHDKILKEIENLKDFTPENLEFFKQQVIRGIRLRKKMKAIPIKEVEGLYVSLFAILAIEQTFTNSLF